MVVDVPPDGPFVPSPILLRLRLNTLDLGQRRQADIDSFLWIRLHFLRLSITCDFSIICFQFATSDFLMVASSRL